MNKNGLAGKYFFHFIFEEVITDWLASAWHAHNQSWAYVVVPHLTEWVLKFIWEDAGQEVRGDFVCHVGMEDVIVYQSVAAEEGELLSRCIKDIISEIVRGRIGWCSWCTLYFMFLN